MALQLAGSRACVKLATVAWQREAAVWELAMRITCEQDVNRGLSALGRKDPRLAAMAGQCGPVPLRLSEPGFSGMASIVVSQQVSRASADAIYGRLRSIIDPLEAASFLAAGEDAWRAAGLSRPKQRTLVNVAEAVAAGTIDLGAICNREADEAIAELTSVKGIGPWTAEIYLLFCAGHADIFPAGDLALQEAIRIGYGMTERPGEKKVREIAASWSPWRGVAARLLWDFYRVMRQDGMPSAGLD